MWSKLPDFETQNKVYTFKEIVLYVREAATNYLSMLQNLIHWKHATSILILWKTVTNYLIVFCMLYNLHRYLTFLLNVVKIDSIKMLYCNVSDVVCNHLCAISQNVQLNGSVTWMMIPHCFHTRRLHSSPKEALTNIYVSHTLWVYLQAIPLYSCIKWNKLVAHVAKWLARRYMGLKRLTVKNRANCVWLGRRNMTRHHFLVLPSCWHATIKMT